MNTYSDGRVVAAAGSIPVLMSMEQDGGEQVKMYAAVALGRLAVND